MPGLSLVLTTLAAHAMGAGPATAPAPGPQLVSLTCDCYRENMPRALNQILGQVVTFARRLSDGSLADYDRFACRRKFGHADDRVGACVQTANYRKYPPPRAGRTASDFVIETWESNRERPPSCVQGYDRLGRWYDTCR